MKTMNYIQTKPKSLRIKIKVWYIDLKEIKWSHTTYKYLFNDTKLDRYCVSFLFYETSKGNVNNMLSSSPSKVQKGSLYWLILWSKCYKRIKIFVDFTNLC